MKHRNLMLPGQEFSKPPHEVAVLCMHTVGEPGSDEEDFDCWQDLQLLGDKTTLLATTLLPLRRQSHEYNENIDLLTNSLLRFWLHQLQG